MFDKILIANRGEIACRVIRTAREMGVRTVAVYSEADARARHVLMADEAYLIGPAAVAESYLRAEKIIEVARKAGAQAIHPGYGFLSENAAFAEACADAGIVFIGPPPAAIRAMGLKDAAKAIMEKAGVPVVPGYHGERQDNDFLLEQARQIGFPVLIKAVAGGGGKGMRRVDAEEDFIEALDGARREAKAAFGDERVLLEKFLLKPRHIEIQVFADSHGNAVHLYERDCSLQRRHQKVVEEAPAPDMPDDIRAAMGRAAVAAAQAIGYEGAGTVEFIADVSDGLKPDGFYFMEMNTRLQVEHPVTEMITGQDLVAWQLQVASGGSLPCAQEDLSIEGHAFEARIYAEDAERGFLPATGVLKRFRMPGESAHIRIDTGVREGDTITPYYDPMIAKLIVWDRDRAAALRRLRGALAKCEIVGCVTNLPFLAAVAAHPAFAAGEIDTGFIEHHADDLVPEPQPASNEAVIVAVLDLVLTRREAVHARAQAGNDPHSPWNLCNGWRMNGIGEDRIRVIDHEWDLDVLVRYLKDGSHEIVIGDDRFRCRGEREEDGGIGVDIDGRRLRASVHHDADGLSVTLDGRTVRLRLLDPLHQDVEEEDAGGSVLAPLPGRIIKVMVSKGDKVQKGQGLMILEAMKMEHTIAAPADGVVTVLDYAVGDQVEEGVPLLEIEEG